MVSYSVVFGLVVLRGLRLHPLIPNNYVLVSRKKNRLKFWRLNTASQEDIREEIVHRYRTDEGWRKKKNMEVSARAKTFVECSGCGRVLRYCSMKPHTKCCKGRGARTTLQELLDISLKVSPLVESRNNLR